jgi:starch phosphorylase
VKVQTNAAQHLFEAEVHLNDLEPNVVRVELYADGIKGGSPIRQEMTRIQPPAGASGGYVYGATVSAARPSADYTVRVIPRFDGVAVPLEVDPILWQR